VALLDLAGIGLLLRWRVPAHAVFLLAAANPVQAARMALLSLAEPSLATLGPVGFYLTNRIGTRALFTLGVAWPVALGAGAWCLALWRFRRGDVV
jgi:ABC-2 type transport system permease protein